MRTSFIWSFTKFNGLSWITKSPPNLIANVVTPACLVFIIYLLSGGKLLPFAIVGGFVAMIAASSLTVTGQSAMFRLEFRLQDLIIATRTGIVDYMLGFAMGNMVFVLPGMAFFAALTVIFGLFTFGRILVTLAVVFLLSLATTPIAFYAGSKIKRTIGMWAISGIVSALMTLLPPTFYPYTVLPKPLLYILALSPVTPAAATLQGVYGLAPMDYYMPLLLVIEVVFYTLAARALTQWREV